ncbi:response regulator [Cyclobacterium jeungdonense]|uniref:Response regulator n=1 Tax=Cyclobacterium jeungdonense TaxID=708087 RepID=A0ABT8C9K8_9BACT|nr:response regulator [Cyclobacterium jeungdonense]MDN3688822.1 response regulator [Cyclobacterium jeungdonense]
MKEKLETIIVDDDILTLHYIRKIVKTSPIGGPIHTSENGKLAFDVLDNRKDEFDNILVFLDINMPVMDGWSFLDTLQNKDYKDKIQVVMVTSSTDPEDKAKSGKYPQVIGYLEKPVYPQVFTEIYNLFDKNIVITKNKGAIN